MLSVAKVLYKLETDYLFPFIIFKPLTDVSDRKRKHLFFFTRKSKRNAVKIKKPRDLRVHSQVPGLLIFNYLSRKATEAIADCSVFL